MPNRGSWNGRWSGENDLYCIIKSFSGKKGEERAKQLAAQQSHYYTWNDGWGASVGVSIVDGKTASAMKKKSRGFCGYNWMVESILAHGAIYTEAPKPVVA